LPQKIILYFHANAEDVIQLYQSGTVSNLKNGLKENYNLKVLMIEYPGYGFFSHEIQNGESTNKKLKCRTKWIKENAFLVLNHVLKATENGGMGYNLNDVILMGRSIGTGPATYLASLSQYW